MKQIRTLPEERAEIFTT